MLYVGVDTHKFNSFPTIVNSEGDIVEQKQISTTKQAFNAALSVHEEPLSACVEAGYNWGPVYDWLDDLCDDTVLAHPARVRLIGESMIKTDKIDSEILAHLLRAGLIPEAYAGSADERAKKRVLRHRMFLVRLRTKVKNRIHCLLTQHGLQRPKVSDLCGKVGMRWLHQLELPAPDSELFSVDLALLEQIEDHIASSEGLIARLAKGDEAVRRLRSVPGIGKFFSVLIALEIGDISRFASAGKPAAWCRRLIHQAAGFATVV